MFRLIHNFSLSVLAALLLCGCHREVLVPFEPLPESRRLAAERTQHLSFAVCESEGNQHFLGHQFLLVALPFGRIETRTRFDDALRNVFQELAPQYGYRPQLVSSCENEEPPCLLMCPTEISATVYDYIFVRHVVARADVLVQTHLFETHESTVALPVAVRESGFHTYGFSAEISLHVLNALHNVMKKTLTSLPRMAVHNRFRRRGQVR